MALPLPDVPSTHRWIDGGAIVRYVGTSGVTGPAPDSVMYCWDRDTGARVADLYDQDGQANDTIPVRDHTFYCAVPKSVAKPVFSVGETGGRFSGNDWDMLDQVSAHVMGDDGVVTALWNDTGSDFRTAADADLGATYVPQTQTQQAESTPVPLFQVTPQTAGWTPAEAEFNSFPNNGAGAGTYNHALHIGFNTGRHSGGPVTAGKPAIYMGFEDNYYDPDADLAYGVEWYVGYVSPDGTTVPTAALRPFYTRVIDSTENTTDKSVLTTLDIGSGADGQFSIWGSIQDGTQLFTVTPTQVLSNLPLNVLGGGQYSPLTGPVNLLLKSATNVNAADTASLTFQLGATPKFQLTADKFNEIYLFDNTANRIHTNWVTGADSDNAYVEFNATLKLNNSTATSATAGAATALPATPQGYFQIKDSAGVVRKVPYYV